MKFSDVAVARVPAHNHPSVAGWRITRSLRARLLVLVALVVAVVIGIEAYIQTNLFARNLERDLLEMGRHTAQSVADDIEVRMNPSDTAALSAQLHDLIEASPAIRSISVVTAPGGAPDVLASTSSEMRPAALEAGRLAMEQGDAALGRGARAHSHRCAAGLARRAAVRGRGREPLALLGSAAGGERVSRDAVVRAGGDGPPDAAGGPAHAPADPPADRRDQADDAAGSGGRPGRPRPGAERQDEIGAVASGLNTMLARDGGLQRRAAGARARGNERAASAQPSW
jgi:hypothetical protein